MKQKTAVAQTTAVETHIYYVIVTTKNKLPYNKLNNKFVNYLFTK